MMREFPVSGRPSWIQKFKKAEMAVLFVLWLAVAVLQMKRIRLGVITSYGADVFMPAWLYVCSRESKTLLRFLGLRLDRPVIAAGVIFGLSVAWEIGQKLHLIRGVYDPLDIVAYGVGIAAVFLIDLWLLGPGHPQPS
jgi:hypothetical protein